MKLNSYTTGIYLCSYETDMPNGTVLGWDADYGYVVAQDGKVIPCPEDMTVKDIVQIEKRITHFQNVLSREMRLKKEERDRDEVDYAKACIENLNKFLSTNKKTKSVTN